MCCAWIWLIKEERNTNDVRRWGIRLIQGATGERGREENRWVGFVLVGERGRDCCARYCVSWGVVMERERVDSSWKASSEG